MRTPRRTAPKVKGGKVQRKNRWELSPHYGLNEGDPVIEKEKAGELGKHFLRVEDVKNFIGILPDWEELSIGLRAIVLARGEEDCYGWHRPGIVAICAWGEGLESRWGAEHVEDTRQLLDRVDVEVGEKESDEDGWQYHEMRFTRNSIRAFLLMDVLLHELGHHHDRMTTNAQETSSRGEAYAEQYAIRYATPLWDRFHQIFPY